MAESCETSTLSRRAPGIAAARNLVAPSVLERYEAAKAAIEGTNDTDVPNEVRLAILLSDPEIGEAVRAQGLHLLIVDDFALRRLDARQSSDIYEVIIERHKRASTIFTSNRTVEEWIDRSIQATIARVKAVILTMFDIISKVLGGGLAAGRTAN